MSITQFVNEMTNTDQTPIVAEGDKIFGEDLQISVESIEGISVEAETEIAVCEAALSEFGTIEASLESIDAFLTTAHAAGGATPQAGEFAVTMYNTVTDKIEAFRADVELPSMESFEADGASLGQTEIAMEAVGETVKKVIAAIKSVIDKAIKAALKFYDQHLSLAGRLEGSAKKLKGALAKAKGSPKEGTLKPGGLEYLFVDGAYASNREIIDLSKTLAKGGKGIVRAVIAYRKAIEGAKATNLADANGKIKAAKAELQTAAVEGFQATVSVDPKQAQRLAGIKSGKHSVSKPLPGNRRLFVSQPAEGSDKFLTVRVITDSILKEPMASYPAKGASAAADALNTAMAILEAHKELVSLGRQMAEAGKGLISSVDKAGKTLDGAEGVEGEQFKDFEDGVKDVKELVNVIRTPFVDLAKLFVQVANANVQLGAAEMKNLAAKKKAD